MTPNFGDSCSPRRPGRACPACVALQTSPARTAATAAWTRFSASSFSRMLETWVLTVSGLITSSAAISLFSCPRRSGSAPRAPPRQRGAVAAVGGRRRLPPARARSGRRRSAEIGRSHHRRRRRSQPGSRRPRVLQHVAASARHDRLRNPVFLGSHGQHQHPGTGTAPSSLLVVSLPDPPGIRISIRTTSGSVSRASATAPAASSACPTTSTPLLQVFAQTAAKEGVVVNDQDANAGRRGARLARPHDATSPSRPLPAPRADARDPPPAARCSLSVPAMATSRIRLMPSGRPEGAQGRIWGAARTRGAGSRSRPAHSVQVYWRPCQAGPSRS